MIMKSPYTLPICGLVAILAVVYSSYTTKDLLEGMTVGIRNYVQSDPSKPDDAYIPEIPTEQEILESDTHQEAVTYATSVTLDLPQAEPTEQEMTEPQTKPSQQATTPPATQKPAQTTKPQTQKPSTQGTTQAQTQKPKPVTGWNVTYAQAKNMVKADSAYDYEDLYWLSRIISAEAKGESFTGQIGVGTVVLNRVRSKQFPNSVKGVVLDQKYGTQFTPVANGSIYNTPTKSAIVAAKMCLDGYTLSNSVLYFLNPSIATSSWIQNNRKYAFRVGNHEFYY